MKLKSYITTALAAFTLAATAADEAKKPNLLFVLVDDFGAMDMSYAGSKAYNTPNIDALVKDGMLFKNAYAAHPRCVPSRYGIFSGRIPGRDGVPGFEDKSVDKHTLSLSRVTWGEVLTDAGYSTGYIGKWHLGKKGGEPDKQGFTDSRIAGEAGAPPSYFYPYHKSRTEGHKTEHFEPVPGKDGEYLTDRLTNEALDFIGKNKDKPFALVLAHYAVHTPLEAPEDTVKIYKKRIKGLGIDPANGRNDTDIVTQGNGSSKTVQNNPTYAAMIDHVDKGIGQLRAKLTELGIADNTVIILTSDHGGLSTRSKGNKRPLATTNAPYRTGKGWLYEGGTRVPHIVVWPGKVKPGSVSAHQTLGTDHYQSILDILSVKTPEALDINSVSYLPALTGKEEQRTPLFFHSPLGRPTQTGDHPASSIIDGKWKLFQLHGSNKLELYNIEADPSESNDLAATEKDQVERLNKLLKQTKEKLGTKERNAKQLEDRAKREKERKAARKNKK